MKKNILYEATYGVTPALAGQLKLTTQGLSSKIRSNPMLTVKELLIALVSLNEIERANLIIEDFSAFVRVESGPLRKREFSSIETLDRLQKVIRSEFLGAGRPVLLHDWRKLLAVANVKVRRLSDEGNDFNENGIAAREVASHVAGSREPMPRTA